MGKKPAWLIYAAEARNELDKVKPSKSGKHEEQAMLRTWKRACADFGYPGEFYEWEILLHRLGSQ